MKIVIQILLIISIGTASCADMNRYDKLFNSKEVSIIADGVPWPKKKSALDYKKIVFSNFSFLVPEDFDSLLMDDTTPGFILNYDGKKIYIEIISLEKFEDKYKTDIGITDFKVIDFPKVMFTKTPKYYEEKAYENEFLISLFKHKKMYFGRVNKAFISSKGPLSAYYISESLPGWGPYAIVTDSTYPDKLLNIQFLDAADIEQLKELISTIGE